MNLFTHLTDYCNQMQLNFKDKSFKDVFILENNINNTVDVYELLDNKEIAVTTFNGRLNTYGMARCKPGELVYVCNESISTIKYDNILDFKSKNIHIYPECWDIILTPEQV